MNAIERINFHMEQARRSLRYAALAYIRTVNAKAAAEYEEALRKVREIMDTPLDRLEALKSLGLPDERKPHDD